MQISYLNLPLNDIFFKLAGDFNELKLLQLCYTFRKFIYYIGGRVAGGKKEYKNLFDAVSHVESKRHENEKKEISSDSQEDGIMEKGKRLYDEIALGLEHAFRFNDVTPSQFRAYLSRPQNFSAQEWEEIQQQKEKNNELVDQLEEKMKAEVAFEQIKQWEKEYQDRNSSEQVEEAPEKVPQEEDISHYSSQTSTADIRSEKPEKKKKTPITRRGWLNMH